MTSPLREMAAAASEMAKGNYDRRVPLVVARRGRRARPGVQPHGRRARRDRPRAARPRRQRVARAAHADHRAAGRAREPGRRRHRARPRDLPHDAGAGRAARPPGQAAARPLPPRVGRGAARAHRVPGRAAARRTRCASSSLHAPGDRGVGRRSTRPTSPPTAIPSACTRSSPTCSRTRCATRRAAASSRCARAARATRRHHRGARRRPRHPRGRRRPASSSASTAPTPPARRATAAPASASPSPSGSSTSTAATSTPNGGSRTAAAWSSPFPTTSTTEETPMSLATIDEALKRIRRGEMVLVVDDEDRENEGDLTMAASWVTRGGDQLHAALGRGLVCMPCDARPPRRARLVADGAAGPRRLRHRRSRVSIDHVTAGSGIGAADRARTIRTVLDPDSPPVRLPAPGPRVPAAGPPGRRARAPRPHRGRRSTSPASPASRRSRRSARCSATTARPARFPYLERFAVDHRIAMVVGRPDRRAPPHPRRHRRLRPAHAPPAVAAPPSRRASVVPVS